MAVGNLSLKAGEQFALPGPVERQFPVADMDRLGLVQKLGQVRPFYAKTGRVEFW